MEVAGARGGQGLRQGLGDQRSRGASRGLGDPGEGGEGSPGPKGLLPARPPHLRDQLPSPPPAQRSTSPPGLGAAARSPRWAGPAEGGLRAESCARSRGGGRGGSGRRAALSRRVPGGRPRRRRKAFPRTPAVVARRFRPETNGPAEAKAPPPGRRHRPLGLSGADAVEGARRARAFELAGPRVLASRVCRMGAGALCRDAANVSVRPEAPLSCRARGRVRARLRRTSRGLPSAPQTRA